MLLTLEQRAVFCYINSGSAKDALPVSPEQIRTSHAFSTNRQGITSTFFLMFQVPTHFEPQPKNQNGGRETRCNWDAVI